MTILPKLVTPYPPIILSIYTPIKSIKIDKNKLSTEEQEEGAGLEYSIVLTLVPESSISQSSIS